jgi:hypothetical protein
MFSICTGVNWAFPGKKLCGVARRKGHDPRSRRGPARFTSPAFPGRFPMNVVKNETLAKLGVFPQTGPSDKNYAPKGVVFEGLERDFARLATRIAACSGETVLLDLTRATRIASFACSWFAGSKEMQPSVSPRCRMVMPAASAARQNPFHTLGCQVPTPRPFVRPGM